MALRLTGTDPFLRASIGAFNGVAVHNGALSGASLFKLSGTGSWRGLHGIDNGSTSDYCIPYEFDPSNELAAANNGGGTWTSAATFTDTTNFMIVGFTWDGTNTAGHWVWRYKIGAGSFTTEADTATTNLATAGSGYRHLIGNVANLGDDGSMDWVCTGLIRADVGATLHNLTMADIASWDAIFTGASAWLLDGQAIGSRTDRTGNGGNEVSRSAGVTLVSDPAGFSWGGAAAHSLVFPSRTNRNALLRR